MKLWDMFFPPKVRPKHLDFQASAEKDHDLLVRESELTARQEALRMKLLIEAQIQRARRRTS